MKFRKVFGYVIGLLCWAALFLAFFLPDGFWKKFCSCIFLGWFFVMVILSVLMAYYYYFKEKRDNPWR